MNELLAKLIPAARNEDFKGWMNILIVVILAVFWAVGGILKARAKKPEQEEEQLAGKPTRRRPQAATGVQKELFQQGRSARAAAPVSGRQYRRQVEQLRRKVRRPQPVVQAITPKKPMPVLTSEALEEPGLPKLKPEVQPAIEELPELISKPLKKPEAKYTGIPAERPEAALAIEPLLDYADPEALRRAILHYEILGKPLSIRGPEEHIIGL